MHSFLSSLSFVVIRTIGASCMKFCMEIGHYIPTHFVWSHTFVILNFYHTTWCHPREWYCSVMNMMILQKFNVTYDRICTWIISLPRNYVEEHCSYWHIHRTKDLCRWKISSEFCSELFVIICTWKASMDWFNTNFHHSKSASCL